MKFLSDILAKAGLTVDGVVTLNNTATGQTPASNDNSTKLATTAWVRTFVQPYSLPIASTSILGGIKVGTGLSIDAGSGILSVTGGGAASIKSTQTFTATAAQTVFTITGGYSVGLIDVFLNGVYLSPNQTTATNGTTITLGDAAAAGDIIDVIVASPVYEGATTTTDQLPEGSTNLYFTNARARSAVSLTTTGVSGVATYNSSTGVFNIPNYQGLVPSGGTVGQILTKNSSTDYDSAWIENYAEWTAVLKHRVKAGEAITKGQAVYVSSADGTNMVVSKASNATEGTSSKTMGLLESTVSTNGFTNVITEGLLGGLNTATATAGDPVWLGTGGNLIYGLLNKPYAPAHLVFIGVVTRVNANNGEIFVKVQNGFELDELHDLSVKNASDGDMIKYVASTGLWTKIAASTTNIVEGTNLYYTQSRFDTAFAAKSTSNLTEGTNLYYTQGRFDTAFAAKSTTNLTEGTNLYYTTARANADFDTRLATKSTTNLAEGTNLYYTDARVGTYLTNNSYATQTYVNTAVSNLVDAAPGTLDTLNELAAALGDDPNFATTVATSIGTKEPAITAGTTGQYWRGDKSWQTLPIYTLSGLGGVPTTRTITINGTAQDLSADRTFTINSMVYPGAGIALSTGSAWGTSITDNSANWNTAFGWGNHASGGYLTTALAATTYASLTGAYANPAFVASLAYSKITGVPAFLTSYTETDPYRVTTVTVSGTSTKTITLTRADASTVTTTWTDYDTDTNTYVTSAGFSGGTLTLTRNDAGTVTVSLDGRYYLATNPSSYITSSALSSYLPLSGGSLTGNLTFSTQGSKIIFGDSISAAPSMIGEGLVDTEGTDSDFLTIYARNSLRIYSTGISERVRVDNSGIRVYGTIIKDGGTSSQFLKADGSIDSNTYAVASSYLPLVGGNMTGQILFLSTSAPFSFQNNGNTGTYTQTTIYANQNNTSGSTANGIFIERGFTDTSNTEVRYFVIGSRGGGIQWRLDGAGNVVQTGSITAPSATINGTSNGYLTLNATSTGGNESGIFFQVGGGNKWENYTANNDTALNWYSYANSTIVFKLAATGAATFSSSVKSTRYLIAPSGTAAVYNFVDSDQSYAGSYNLQAGGGSLGYGGSLVMYGHSHASRAGYVSAGISTGSGGKFTVMSGGNGSGSDVFTVDASGVASLSSSLTIGTILGLKASVFGYSSSYPTLIVGPVGNDTYKTLCFGVDVSGNPSGAFSGTGSEYVWRNTATFITPNSSNNGFNTLLSWNSSGQITISGATTVGSLSTNGDITISGYRIKELSSTNRGIYIGNWGGAGYWGLGSTANAHELKLDQVSSTTGFWEGATDVNLYLGSNRLVLHSGNISSYALTSYTETDTLSTVVSRGNSTSSAIRVKRPTNKVDNSGATEFGGRVEYNNSFNAGASGYTIFYYPSDYVFRILADYDGNIGGAQPHFQIGYNYIHVNSRGSNIGYVGIGNDAPGYRLDVSGDIRATGVLNIVNDRNYYAKGSLRLTSSSNNASTLDISVTDSTTTIYSNYYSGGNDNNIIIGTYANLSNQLYLKNNGNVGIYTTNPGTKFWMQQGVGTFACDTVGDSSINTFTSSSLLLGPRAARTGTSGTYMAGISFDHLLNYNGVGSTYYSGIPHAWVGIRTVDFPGWERSALVFATRQDVNGTAGTTIERACITPYGQLLINAQSSGYGTLGYGYNLGVRGNSSQVYMSFALNNQTLDTQGLIVGIDTTYARFHARDNKGIMFANNDIERVLINTSGSIIASGDITAYGSPSDARLKTIKSKVTNATEKISKLNGYHFDWNEVNDLAKIKEDVGVIAQEVADVFPELARTNEDGFMSVRYQGLTAVLIEAVKEQQTQIESQKSEIDVLKDLVQQLINR
jgi:hypothetical protein